MRRLVFTSLRIVGLGVAVALPTLIVTAWIANVARRVSANAPGSRKFGDPAARLSASPTRQGRSAVWSVVSKASVAALFIVVAIGMTARVRTVILSMEEVDAYRASAERGDSEAQNKLGSMYARGRSVAQDHAEAVFWFRKAAEHGHADAPGSRLMFFTVQGEHTRQHAAQWVRKAAEQGHAGAERPQLLRTPRSGVPWMMLWRAMVSQGRGARPQASATLGSFFRAAVVREMIRRRWNGCKAAEQGHADANPISR